MVSGATGFLFQLARRAIDRLLVRLQPSRRNFIDVAARREAVLPDEQNLRLVSERAAGDELSFLLDRKGANAELLITSGDYRPAQDSAPGSKDGLGISAELAQLVFSAQGGSVKLARNPLTRSLRVTARLPLA